MGIIVFAIQREFPRVISVRTCLSFTQREAFGNILVCIRNKILLAYIAHHILVICSGKRIDGIFLVSQGNVSSQHSGQVTVSVNIFRSSIISSGFLIVDFAVAYIVHDVLVTEK